MLRGGLMGQGTLAIYWGRYGGWSARVSPMDDGEGRIVRIVMGRVAFLWVPRDLDDVLRAGLKR